MSLSPRPPLVQVPYYFLPQKTPHPGPPGSADSRGLRPHAPTLEERWALNFPGAKERIVPEKLRTYKPCANVCATAPGLQVVSFFGTYPNFQSDNAYASLFSPKTSLPGQLGRRRTDFRPKMVSRMTPKALPELPRCAPWSSAGQTDPARRQGNVESGTDHRRPAATRETSDREAARGYEKAKR